MAKKKTKKPFKILSFIIPILLIAIILFGVQTYLTSITKECTTESCFIERAEKCLPTIFTKQTNDMTITNKITNKIKDSQSGFRSYSRKAINSIFPKDNDMGVSAEILLQSRKKNLSLIE